MFLMLLVFTITLGYAQKNVRQTASNFLRNGSMDKAVEAINQCIQDPSTATDPKTWFIRGNIYFEIANNKDTNVRKMDRNALQLAMDSYKKALDFDPAKEFLKKEYYEDIAKRVDWQWLTDFNIGAELYTKKQYKDAMISFENGAKVKSIIGMIDTVSILNAAQCASLAKESAKEKELFLELVKLNYKNLKVYSALAEIYKNERDSSNALKTIRMGQKIYPNNLELILDESNVYITFSEIDKALSTLKVAAEKDPTNYFVYNALGAMNQKIWEDTLKPLPGRKEAFINAETAYKKSLEINPNFNDANLNFGSLYFNIAAPIDLKAKSLNVDQVDEYKKLKDEANVYYSKALPYLKKSDELQPNDLNTLVSLRQIYYNLDDKENSKIILDKINQLRKK